MKIRTILFLLLFSTPLWAADQPAKGPEKPTAKAAPADISVKAEVNRAAITIGDVVVFTVTIKHGPDVQVLSSIPTPDQEILKIKKVEEFKTKDGKYTVEGRKYTLTTFRLGDFVLDPLEIQYRAGGGEVQTVETDKIYITVKSVAEGETKEDIRGIKNILDLPRQILIMLILGLAAVLAGLAFLIYRKFFAKKSEGDARPETKLSPADEALFNLNKLFDSDLLPRGKIKEYYLRLSEILRVYFEKRFGFLAVEYTTDEIMKAMREKGIERELREKVQEVLEAADLAKFAKWKPEPAQIMQINQKSKEIVEVSKPAETPQTPEAQHGV